MWATLLLTKSERYARLPRDVMSSLLTCTWRGGKQSYVRHGVGAMVYTCTWRALSRKSTRPQRKRERQTDISWYNPCAGNGGEGPLHRGSAGTVITPTHRPLLVELMGNGRIPYRHPPLTNAHMVCARLVE